MKQTPLTEERALEKFLTKDEFNEFKHDLFNRLDNIVGQLKTMRDEQTIAYHQHKGL